MASKYLVRTVDGVESDENGNIVSNQFHASSIDIIMDGIQTVFTIPHGYVDLPSSFALTFGNGRNVEFIQSDRTIDATNITITCDSAPNIGIMTVYWQAFK